jgi:hypothetical protein
LHNSAAFSRDIETAFGMGWGLSTEV